MDPHFCNCNCECGTQRKLNPSGYWSDAHFTVLENYAKSLGELGQKAVTLVVSDVPWAGQDCRDEYRMAANLFEYSIIPVTKTSAGNTLLQVQAKGQGRGTDGLTTQNHVVVGLQRTAEDVAQRSDQGNAEDLLGSRQRNVADLLQTVGTVQLGSAEQFGVDTK